MERLSYRGTQSSQSYCCVQSCEENEGLDGHDGSGGEALKGGDRFVERDWGGPDAFTAVVAKLPQDDGHGQETRGRLNSNQ